MNQCSSCGREIPDTATVCDECAQWAAAVVVHPSPDKESTEPDSYCDPAPYEPASYSTEPEPYSIEPEAYSTEPEPYSTEPASYPIETVPDSLDSIEAVPPVEAPAAVPGRRMNRSLIAVLAVAGIGIPSVGWLLTRSTPASTAVTATASTAAAKPSPAPAARRVSGTHKWSSRNSTYWVGNRRKSVAFELPAENTVSVWMRSVRPALVVRCMGRGTEVFVVTESAMKIEPQSDDHTVTFGFDNEATASEKWPDSEEHDALFARDGAAFAERLMHAETLRFGFTPHNAEPVVAQFNVAGLRPLLEPAARECGKKK